MLVIMNLFEILNILNFNRIWIFKWFWRILLLRFYENILLFDIVWEFFLGEDKLFEFIKNFEYNNDFSLIICFLNLRCFVVI